jgi:hypothetical protein
MTGLKSTLSSVSKTESFSTLNIDASRFSDLPPSSYHFSIVQWAVPRYKEKSRAVAVAYSARQPGLSEMDPRLTEISEDTVFSPVHMKVSDSFISYSC